MIPLWCQSPSPPSNRELRPGGMSHHENTLRIAAMVGDVFMHPTQGLGDVSNQRSHRHFGQQPIVGRDEHEAAFGERPRLDLNARLVTGLPATAMDPADDRQVLGVALLSVAGCVGNGTGPGDLPGLDPALVAAGEEIFRYDTFGDEVYWTDTLRMHEVIEGARDAGHARLGRGDAQRPQTGRRRR